MITYGVMGGAGTGKTTRLLRCMEDRLRDAPLMEGQKVLALTFMHGARMRLADRLAKSSVRSRVECSTFDRFAWQICQRWRTRLRDTGVVLNHVDDHSGYEACCSAAGKLLAQSDVAGWLVARYPIVVTDEFQDCAGGRLEMLKALHGRARLLIAADDFQNLFITVVSPAVHMAGDSWKSREFDDCASDKITWAPRGG
jgi:superfamily I DNA/RNA helicase